MRLPAIALAALLLAAAPAHAAPNQAPATARAFAEREALLRAHERCDLLADATARALRAAANQARSALLVAGWPRAEVDALARGARGAVDDKRCADPSVTGAAQLAEAGFEGWRRMHDLSTPGVTAGWTARRTPDPGGWLLWQDPPRGGRIGVVLVGRTAEFAFAPSGDPDRYISARLIMRDPLRAVEPILSVRGQALATPVLPPAGAARVWLATRRAEDTTQAFIFPPDAFALMGALDPREGALVELVGPDGRVVGRSVVELGELAAVQAFLAASES